MPPKAKPKKANGYERPAEIKLGTVLTDNMKNSWKVGPSIGSGGFGDIYSCISAGGGHSKKAEDYPHVLKIVSLPDALNYDFITSAVIFPGAAFQWTAVRGDALLCAQLQAGRE